MNRAESEYEQEIKRYKEIIE